MRKAVRLTKLFVLIAAVVVVCIGISTYASTSTGVFYWYGSQSGYTDNSGRWHSWSESVPAQGEHRYDSNSNIISWDGYSEQSRAWSGSVFYSSGRYEKKVVVTYYKADPPPAQPVDTTPPAAPTINPSNLVKGNVTVTIGYSSDSVVKQYRIGAGVYQNYSAPFTVPDDSVVYAKAKDAAGNWCAEVKKEIHLAPPSITANPNAGDIFTGQTITFNVSDAKGVKITQYKWDNETTPKTAASPSSFSVAAPMTAAVHTLYVQSTDNLGNSTVWIQYIYNVKSVAVTGVSLDKTTMSLAVNNSYTLIPSVSPVNATNKTVAWGSSNTSIAVVDDAGKVTAKAPGTATITVTTQDGNKIAQCTVTVPVSVTGVTLNKTTLNLGIGRSETLIATVTPSNAVNKTVRWSSSNPKAASVDGYGKVTAIASGTTTITVTTADGGKTANCTVAVSPVAVSGVTLNKTTLALGIGSSFVLVPVITPSDATVKTVVWGSGNTNVASVDDAGKVTAKAVGTAKIVVSTTDGNKTAECIVTVTTVPVAGISLDKSTMTLAVNNSYTLVPTVSPSNATNKIVTWGSSNTSVAVVDDAGKVTAKGPGAATITVTTQDGNKIAQCTVTVPVSVTGVTLNKTIMALELGRSEKLIATVAPSNAANKNVTWISSNISVATVDANGEVTAKASGIAVITVKTADGGKTASCAVTVTPVAITGVTLDKTTLSLGIGSSYTLVPIIIPSDATDKRVTWGSSNTSVAVVDDAGKVTAKAVGTAKIVVSTLQGNKTAECTVTVTTVGVTGVSLDKTTLSLVVGQTYTLVPTVSPSNATSKTVTWGSSNTSVAVVDDAGKVTAKGPGAATITVTTQDGNKVAQCIVTVPMSVTGVNLNKSTLTIGIGRSEKLAATVAPSNATNKNVTWSSSNMNVVTVDAGGEITAKAAGTAVITVKTADGGKTASCAVTVIPVGVTGVNLNKSTLSMGIGTNFTLVAAITPSDATNKTVTWGSTNTNVVVVDDTGKVTAKSVGTAKIVVSTQDGNRTDECTVTVTAVGVIGVSLDKTTLTLAVNNSYTLVPTVSPSNATNKTITWGSNNTNVAIVDNAGKVTAKAPGTATITVTTQDGNRVAQCTVTVPMAVAGVSLNKTILNLTAGNNETLTATITPDNATNKRVTWTSNNTSAATVDNSGKVTAVAAGTAKITVTTVDGSKTAECTVTVTAAPPTAVAVTGVTLNRTTLELTVGNNETLAAEVAPSNATNKRVTWASNNTSVATVDNSGKVTAVAAGTAKITVTTADGNKTAECTVTVTAAPPTLVPVTGVSLNKTTLNLTVGHNGTLAAEVAPSNATNKNVTWSSNNTSVATVDNTGKVTAVASGTAKITVTTADGSKTAECTVTIAAPERLAAPELSVESGRYDKTFSVRLLNKSDYPRDTKFYYTLDGTEPSPNNSKSKKMLTSVSIRQTETLKVVAVSGEQTSEIVSRDYRIVPKAPRVTPSVKSGTYTREVKVRFSKVGYKRDTQFFYTLDGTTPTEDSEEWDGDYMVIDETTTLKAIAVYDGESSSVATFQYNFAQ